MDKGFLVGAVVYDLLMSITDVAAEANSPACAGVALTAWADRLDAVLDDLTGVDITDVDAAEAIQFVRRMSNAVSRVTAAKLAAVAVVDRHGAARRLGATSTAAWLRSEGQGAGAARREVDLAEALAEPMHQVTREQLSKGRVSAEHAAVITKATDTLSDAVTAEQRVAFQAGLLLQAEQMDPYQLRDAARRAATRIDPKGSADLERAERAQRAEREFVMYKGRGGGYVLGGNLDAIGAATLAAALDPLSAPRPSSVDGPDPRTPARRRGDGLVELARRALAGGDLPDSGGLRPQVVVTMTLDQLQVGRTSVRRRRDECWRTRCWRTRCWPRRCRPRRCRPRRCWPRRCWPRLRGDRRRTGPGADLDRRGAQDRLRRRRTARGPRRAQRDPRLRRDPTNRQSGPTPSPGAPRRRLHGSRLRPATQLV